jgi:hypothetical protein
MRLFMKQQNVIETSPVLDAVSKEPQETLTIEFKVYDSTDTLVTNSDITLAYVSNGIYRGTCPELTSLVENATYKVELKVKNGPITIWYFKGPAKAIIRTSLV